MKLSLENRVVIDGATRTDVEIAVRAGSLQPSHGHPPSLARPAEPGQARVAPPAHHLHAHVGE